MTDLENVSKSPIIHVFEGESIRVLLDDQGEPRFVAADIGAVLEHSNIRVAVASLDEDEKGVSLIYTPGGVQSVTTVSEAGLYTLIMRSDKPQAKPFRRWVTHEVLPSIRKTGAYRTQVPAFDPADPRVIVAVLEAQVARVALLEAQVAEAAPKVEVYDRIIDSGDTVGFREAAKLIRAATGANEHEVRGMMRSRGWIQRLGKQLAPASYGETHGYTTTRDREYAKPDGSTGVRPELRITHKGVARAIEVLIAEEVV